MECKSVPHFVSNKLATMRSRTNRYIKSFLSDATSSCNICITHFANMPTFDYSSCITDVFKDRKKKTLNCSPGINGIYARRFLIYARLIDVKYQVMPAI